MDISLKIFFAKKKRKERKSRLRLVAVQKLKMCTFVPQWVDQVMCGY